MVLTGGPGAHDKALGDAIEKVVLITNMIGKTKPKQLLALIECADVLLCPDTGPAHVATAVSTPVVALHAVTSARVSGPYLYQHLAVDGYPDAVRTVLKSTPDTIRWGTQVHGNDTMKLISVDAVIAKLETVLSQSYCRHKSHCSFPASSS